MNEVLQRFQCLFYCCCCCRGFSFLHPLLLFEKFLVIFQYVCRPILQGEYQCEDLKDYEKQYFPLLLLLPRLPFPSLTNFSLLSLLSLSHSPSSPPSAPSNSNIIPLQPLVGLDVVHTISLCQILVSSIELSEKGANEGPVGAEESERVRDESACVYFPLLHFSLLPSPSPLISSCLAFSSPIYASRILWQHT